MVIVTAGPAPQPLVAPTRLAPPAAMAWVAALASAAVATAGVAVAVAWSVPITPYAVLVALLYPTVGALIIRRHPRNLIGWLLIAIGAVNAVVALSIAWAVVALDVSPGALPGGRGAGQVMAWLADGIWILSYGAFLTFIPLLFPDGRLPSKRWAPVLAFNVLAVAVQFGAPLSVLSQIWRRGSYHDSYPDERLAGTVGQLGYDLVRVGAVLAIVALVWRLRAMSQHERGPYLWFAAGALAGGILLVPIEVLSEGPGYEIVRLFSVVLLPVGALVAILHHGAYGIDVVLNRTIVYGVLTVAVAAVYLASVAVVEQLVRVSSTLSAVAAAGVTAVALSPVRREVQVVVNRAMYGRRDEPHVVSAAIGSRLEAMVDGPETLREVVQEIAAALRLPYVALEGRHGRGSTELAATGSPGPDVERLPLVVHGEVVGALVAGTRRGQGRLSPKDITSLRGLVPLVAAAVAQVQLGADLRRARGRLATVLEDERRRIRRDLHDGLGPALAAVVMGIDEALAVHRDDPDRADRLLGNLKDQTKSAVADIRSLVYGLRPPALDELGLHDALAQLIEGTVGRTALAVDFDAPPSLGELSAATEVAAYRIVQEALTNVVRHSGAKAVKVAVDVRGAALHLGVTDDGDGLPQPLVAGVGIASMRERAEDTGGTLAFGDGPGTSIRAVLPTAAT